MRYAAISLHFDSLGQSYGFPANYKDPTFFEVFDRFNDVAGKYDFKYSIYVIGKDLEKQENRDRVRSWSDQGHEIGNHSWSHFQDLGAMNSDAMRREVKSAHDVLTEVLGKEPKGFVSPAWNSSGKLIELLVEMRYRYDSSGFPSWLYIPVIMKFLANNLTKKESYGILRRKDFSYWLFGPTRPYMSAGSLWRRRIGAEKDKITMMPVPTSRFRFAFWHTLVFMFGWNIYERMLKECLKKDNFYLIVHPADLMHADDLDSSIKSEINIDRIKRPPLDVKLDYLERAIRIIKENGRQIVTMEQLASKV